MYFLTINSQLQCTTSSKNLCLCLTSITIIYIDYNIVEVEVIINLAC